MPTYVYGCDTCGHRFEKFQKFQDAPLTECSECGASVRRIFQPAGIVFKGSGWYSTDSRSTTATPAATDSAGAAEDGKQNGDQPSSTSKGDDAEKPAAKAPAPAERAGQAKTAE